MLEQVVDDVSGCRCAAGGLGGAPRQMRPHGATAVASELASRLALSLLPTPAGTKQKIDVYQSAYARSSSTPVLKKSARRM